jgi:osmotically-inducible protein OsmY
MKKIPALIAAVACSIATLAPIAAFANADTDAATSQAPVVIKDSSIKSSIKAQYAADTFKGLTHIDVDVDDHGVVSLEGRVPSQQAADRAVSIARASEGVREVKSKLKVKIDD